MQNKKQNKSKVLFGELSKTKVEKKVWGSVGTLFSNWDKLKLNGFLINFNLETSYSDWADSRSENLCIVEEGKGVIIFNGVEYPVEKGYVLKIYPGQNPIVKPQKSLKFLSVQKPGSHKMKFTGENLTKLNVINVKDVPSKVYEYETLGQEIFTPKYKNGLGLIAFVFPMREIPFHIHPHSGRLIRTISGKGWTYAEPNLYEMSEDTFTLFPKGVVHTNGPVPGEIFRLYAIQLPWIDSKIDEEHIAGAPRFVKYVGSTPPKKLWKTKKDFMRVISRLSKK
jgi:quercetin dioxygenase-like cupin family protein